MKDHTLHRGRVLGALAATLVLGLGGPAAAAKHLSAYMRVIDGSGALIDEVKAFAEDTAPGQIFTLGEAVDPAKFPSATVVRRPDGSIRDVFGICACGVGGGYAIGFATYRVDATPSPSDPPPPPPPSPPPEFGPPPGHMQITSFFDVFTELTVDGGQTWIPAEPGAHIEYWSKDSVPEPATWAMMVGGLGIAGALLRSRRAVRHQTA
jgi:hypothetical protein